MAGRAGRTYKRDANGRFASTGGGGSKRPAAKRVAKGPNKVTRDNAGRITSVGGEGATMRGGRLRTAGGKLRATQTTRVKAPGAKAGTIAKGGRGVSGTVARSLAAVRKSKSAKPSKPPEKSVKSSKLGFEKADFLRRSQRTASIKNPKVKQVAQRFYGKVIDLESSPKQLKSMFRKLGKPKKSTGKTAAQRQSEREHKAMLGAAKLLFK
jgi:hypothetical protein